MVTDDYDSVRLALVARRKLLGLTQRQVAVRLHSSASYVCQLERGKHMPKHDMWVRWAKALGFDVRVSLRDDGTRGVPEEERVP